MGLCCYRERPTRPILRTIRVVHFDGYIEDYESPASVNQVITIFPKHFMTTPIRLMQVGLVPLKLDTLLEPGKIYFLLPCSFIRFNESSSDLVCLTKKLTDIAKTRLLKPKPTLLANPIEQRLFKVSLPSTSMVKDQPTTPSASPKVKKSTQKSLTKSLSNISKPPRVKPKPKPAPESASTDDKESSETSNNGSNRGPNSMRKSTKGLSWKPLLATIRERSFNRRESDLRDD
ncbi:hypothetical protein L1987_54518 [Smallanthus sonchifolius]|uniref:Uncharacterized protein n=1 Tax=Smallanthus sonchifolius TaxID=185202 RepID=A0ACB9E732_9ASTR|nr:hypothetical protein L1987_54518 [Smallanthus sonchifolius]